jgi:hypothetical protein
MNPDDGEQIQPPTRSLPKTTALSRRPNRRRQLSGCLYGFGDLEPFKGPFDCPTSTAAGTKMGSRRTEFGSLEAKEEENMHFAIVQFKNGETALCASRSDFEKQDIYRLKNGKILSGQSLNTASCDSRIPIDADSTMAIDLAEKIKKFEVELENRTQAKRVKEHEESMHFDHALATQRDFQAALIERTTPGMFVAVPRRRGKNRLGQVVSVKDGVVRVRVYNRAKGTWLKACDKYTADTTWGFFAWVSDAQADAFRNGSRLEGGFV